MKDNSAIPPAPAPTQFAPGLHLLVDHRGGRYLTDPQALETALRGAAEAAGATVLAAHFHHFQPQGCDGDAAQGAAGVTGVLLLAESHISIHTWPETGYAAIDIFVCGQGRAQAAADYLAHALLPDWAQVRAVQRNHFSHPAL
jgi:S-adenosylmethionine decarboxylase